MTTIDTRLRALLAQLTLEEKVQLVTGSSFWTTAAIDRIGLRSMVLSDGPSGVRGQVWDERDPSLNLPSATALSSSWDLELAKQYGIVCAQEARRKGVDIVLGPTINLHRSPLGGRHFEAFSEDPILTSELAAAFVRGVQSNGVAATPKHYIANDSETDRFTVDVVVEDRALRELYLLAFEKSVTAAHAWVVMSSYNSINGTTASENDLLETPLNSEWGFDGVVVSDWTAVRSLESARHSQDLAMPGPMGPWGDALVSAVRAAEIAEEVIDRKVLRLLLLATRVGALDGFGPRATVQSVGGLAFARSAAAAGSVLVKNENELPWDATSLSTIAVIGHNARFARTQGGGSATVLPEHTVSPLEGIRAAVPSAEVSWSLGAVVQQGVAEFPLESISNPATGEPGVLVRFLDDTGSELYREDRRASALVWFGGDAPIGAAHEVELSVDYLPESTGTILVGFAAVGRGRIYADDVLIHDEVVAAEGTDLGAALLSPPSTSVRLGVEAGAAVRLRLDFTIPHGPHDLIGALGLGFGLEPDDSDPDELIAAAVAAASDAEVAIVVVGTNSKVESEGFDRSSLSLPGRQDQLVRAVAAVNPRTIVVVNAGSPVLMPWRDVVEAIVIGYFGGQEFGNAVADIIFGSVEPGGRLPTTWPALETDPPVMNVRPAAGRLEYGEGIHIGYRAWLKAARTPAFAFGYGLGYTTWNFDSLDVTSTIAVGGVVHAAVRMTNTGTRAGKHVVQLYAKRPDSSIERPALWLVGFATVRADAGETVIAHVEVSARAFADWKAGWRYEPGEFTLLAGGSSDSLPLESTVTLSL